ncbi:hypothetical protein IC620_15335 [Hazenella sp. IB182357]|uniref:Uncharacterized protein n=1 Tax=Polycladospora coralii TaxID=2771432 RepID=A0A926NBU2_9BACL|nr:hypothetical protein [Polycladospora coralii]MBD1373718.1 hypothetical protein [Polycladospora coralii]
MIKAPVVVEFIDKHTQTHHKLGSIYESKTKKRIEELQEKGFLGKTTEESSKEKEGQGQNDKPTQAPSDDPKKHKNKK